MSDKSVDIPRFDDGRVFGSAHHQVCNFVFCDGSVRGIPYAIDKTVHRCLGNRRDGQMVKGNDY